MKSIMNSTQFTLFKPFQAGLLLFWTLSHSGVSLAHEYFRPWRADQLPPGTIRAKAYRIKNARVAYANYDLLKLNFPQLKDAKKFPNTAAVDHWILENFAYLSEHQEKLFNKRVTPVDLDKSKVKELSLPPTYGRAGYLEAEDGGLVDIKGIGHAPGKELEDALEEWAELEDKKARLSAVPEHERDAAFADSWAQLERKIEHLRKSDHSDGSMPLGEAIEETAQQQAIQKEFNVLNAKNAQAKNGAPRLETVETLFIIEFDGSILTSSDNHRGDRMALYGREAHTGRKRAAPDEAKEVLYNPAPQHIQTESSRDLNWIQTTNTGTVIDFGATVLVKPEISKVHAYETFDRSMKLRPYELKHFEKAVRNNEYIDSRESGIYRWSFDTANACARESDQACRQAILNHLQAMTSSSEFALSGNFTGDLAELSPEDERRVRLYSRARTGTLTQKDYEALRHLMVNASTSDQADRTRYSEVVSILSVLDESQASNLFALLDQKTIHSFLSQVGEVLINDDQGMHNDLPSMASLYQQMQKNPDVYLNDIYQNQLMELMRNPEGMKTEEQRQFLAEIFRSEDPKIRALAEGLYLYELQDEDFWFYKPVRAGFNHFLKTEVGQKAVISFVYKDFLTRGDKTLEDRIYSNVFRDLLVNQAKPSMEFLNLIKVFNGKSMAFNREIDDYLRHVFGIGRSGLTITARKSYFRACVKQRMGLEFRAMEPQCFLNANRGSDELARLNEQLAFLGPLESLNPTRLNRHFGVLEDDFARRREFFREVYLSMVEFEEEKSPRTLSSLKAAFLKLAGYDEKLYSNYLLSSVPERIIKAVEQAKVLFESLSDRLQKGGLNPSTTAFDSYASFAPIMTDLEMALDLSELKHFKNEFEQKYSKAYSDQLYWQRYLAAHEFCADLQ